MESIELADIWKEYDRKIDEARVLNLQSWALNLHCFETIQLQKVASKFSKLAAFKFRTVILGIIWLAFLGSLAYANHMKNLYFTISLAGIFLITLLSIFSYCRQIIQLKSIRYDHNIQETQKRISIIEISTLQSLRISWLQLPFYTTWFWNDQWINHPSHNFWMIAFPITVCFLVLTLYLFLQLRPENIGQKWVKMLLMAGPEYKSLVIANEFLSEIEKMKQDL